MKKCTLAFLMMFALCTSYAQKPKLSIEVFKRDTSFACIASDSNGYVYVGTNGKRIHQYKNGVWNKFSYGFNSIISWQKTSIQQMAVRNNVLWVAHSGYIFSLPGDVDYYKYGGIESINLATGPGDRKNYRGQRVINVDLTIAGPNTRNTVCVFPDTNGRVWSASKYADSLAFPELYNYNARYWYKTGGVGTKEPGATNFYRKEIAYPAPLNIGVGTNMAGDEANSIGKRKSSTEITASTDDNEILISCDGYAAVGGLFNAGIMRYNRATGDYIGKYDETNTPIPFGTTNTSEGPKAMYTDYKGQVWVALSGGRLARKNVYGWLYIGLPSTLPVGSQFQPHSISGDSKGRIYFGTDNGLLVYDEPNNLPFSNAFFNFYNITDGLPSNYIRATHVDKYNNLWLGTGSGVCKILFGNLHMYTLKPTLSGIYNFTSETKRTIATSFDPKPTTTDTARIAADGTESTLFKWIGASPQNLKCKIKEDFTNNYYEMGKLTERARTPDSLIYSYKHPIALLYANADVGKRELTLQIFDTTTTPPTLVTESNFAIVRPPVLFLHGLWDKGSAWDDLKSFLSLNARYKSYMFNSPSYRNDTRFENNRLVGIQESEKLLNQCTANGFSVGKVDVICHSMGGIVARLGLQHPQFTNTYHKLITLNSPLSGSQVSNFVFGNPALTTLFRTVVSSTNNIDNGALEDIGVASNAVRILLNGTGNLNTRTVPTHALHSDFANFDLNTFAPISNSGWGWIASPVAKFIFLQGAHCLPITPVYECLRDKVYGGEDYDLVVPISSQKAGLPANATTRFNNIFHNDMLIGTTTTFPRILTLLKESSDGADFTTSGYNPPTLNYFGPLIRAASSNETVQITAPITNTSFAAGSSINVSILGSAGITTLALVTGNGVIRMEVKDSALQSGTFNYIIPNNAIGKFYIGVLGYDASGRNVLDTVSINVAPPSGVTLDSIKIINRNNLKVEKEDSLQLEIKGYYSDMVRNISYLNGINYVVDDVNVRPSIGVANKITGLIEGFDKIYISYLGKTDTGYIEILPKTITSSGGTLPVNLISFTGKLVNNNSIQLDWNTSQELNNKYFEIEKSVDGINYKKIGSVNSTGFANNAYNYIDVNTLSATNFYRLKQVDVDGRFVYSNILLIRIAKNKEQNILIYPNPSNNHFTINITEGNHPKWQLSLTNMFGQKILERTIAANQNNEFVKVTTLPTGVYNVVIMDELKAEKVYQGKIIISK